MPGVQAAFMQAQHEDPTLNMSTGPQRAKGFALATTGKIGDSNNALGVAVQHLGSLINNFSTMTDTNTKGGNWLVRKAKENLPGGYPEAGRASTNINGLAAELTRAYRATGGSVEEVEAWKNNFDLDAPMAEKAAKVSEAVDMLEKKIQENEQQYINSGGVPGTELTMRNAQTVQMLEKMKTTLGKYGASLSPETTRTVTTPSMYSTPKPQGGITVGTKTAKADGQYHMNGQVITVKNGEVIGVQ
jgi:hypothetical protein